MVTKEEYLAFGLMLLRTQAVARGRCPDTACERFAKQLAWNARIGRASMASYIWKLADPRQHAINAYGRAWAVAQYTCLEGGEVAFEVFRLVIEAGLRRLEWE